VVITAPASSQGTIRERVSPQISTVDGMQSRERSSRSSAGPATKSSWPPTPESCVPPRVSATTWPWMSISMAPLIVTILRLRAITSAELTTSTGRKATRSFSCS